MTLGEMYEPDEALAAGLLDRVVAPELVDTTLGEIIAALRSLHRASHVTAKTRLRRPTMEAMRGAIDRELTPSVYQTNNPMGTEVLLPSG